MVLTSSNCFEEIIQLWNISIACTVKLKTNYHIIELTVFKNVHKLFAEQDKDKPAQFVPCLWVCLLKVAMISLQQIRGAPADWQSPDAIFD